MTLQERENFRQKMLDEYGPGWEEIVTHYKQQVTPRSRHKYEDYKADWNVDPTRFRTDNPLSLLSSREDIELALREPTKQDYINELDRMDPDSLQGPVRPPMEMRTDRISEGGGHRGVFDPDEIIPYHAESFQNRISPLPHQLEGPETAVGPSYYGYEGMKYDPNQELYDPNYYGTAGQMGQMGASPPGIIPSSVTGRHISPNAPYSVTGMSAMSGGEMPGLLDSGEGQFSQAFPGSDPNEDWQKQGWDNQPAGPLAETSEGGKWEPKGDSIYRSKRMDDYLAKYFMGLGKEISGGPTKFRRSSR